MHAIRNLSISTKLSLVALVNLLITATVGIWALNSLGAISYALNEVYRVNVLGIRAVTDA